MCLLCIYRHDLHVKCYPDCYVIEFFKAPGVVASNRADIDLMSVAASSFHTHSFAAMV